MMDVISIKLQAYERLTIFLERLKPENLVVRCFQSGITTSLLKDVMLQNIKDEFEYNLSQQLYVSEAAWLMVIKAKEETVALINSVFNVSSDKQPSDFSAALFERNVSSISPIQQAQSILKQEVADIIK